MSVFTAAQARQRTDDVIAAQERAPVEQVYSYIKGASGGGASSTIIDFYPFTFPSGGSTDPAAAPFLNELVANGYTLVADVDPETGITRLGIGW